MSLTRVTDNVVTVGTIAPGKLSTGYPEWNSSGVLSAVGFVGDASELSVVGVSAAKEAITNTLISTNINGYINARGFVGYGGFLTNVGLQTDVEVVTANSYTIQPADNFHTLVFTNSAKIFTLNPFAYTNGHRTAVIQYNTQPLQFESEDIINREEFSRTKGLYSKAFLQFTFPYWTVYGDLTSIPPSAAPVVPPAPVGTTSFDKIAAGDSVSYIMSGSRLYSVGSGGSGRLGLNDTNSRSLFTLVSGNWANIFADYRHTGALSGLSANNYDLFMVGDNSYGQLGTNDTNNRSTFTRITAPVNGKWSSVAPGFNNTYALSSTDLYGVGYNNEGQLGLNSSSYSYPYYVTDYQMRSTFTQVPGSWSSFAAEGETVVAIAGGVIYVAGTNPFTGSYSYGFTSTPNPDGNWVKVTCNSFGGGVIVALSVNNRLYYVGGGTFGNPAPTTWTQIPGNYIDLCPYGAYSGQGFWSVIALSATGGKIARLGYVSFTEILPGTWTGVQFINSQLIKYGGAYYVIGSSNYMGKFGLNTGDVGVSVFTQVPGSWSKMWVGDSNSYAVDGSNNLYFSGYQYFYNTIGNPTWNGPVVLRSTFTQIPAGYQPPGTIVDVSTDGYYDAEFVLTNSGTIYARGGFAFGHGGLNTLQGVDIWTALPGSWSTGATIRTTSYDNNSFILNGSTLYTCGQDAAGPLGLLPITTGPFTAYVTNDRSTFTQIPGNWSAVSGSINHVAALSSNGRLFGAGSNTYGVLGLGNASSILRTSTFTVIGSGNWTAIATGYFTTYALSGSRLFACGLNSSGQLGINDLTPRSTLTLLSGSWNNIAASLNSLYALSGTKLFVCGQNLYGQLSLGDTTPRSTLTQVSGNWGFVAGGYYHTIGLSSYDTGKFTPFSAGYNNEGQLGLNDRVTRTTFTTITAG